MNRFQMFRATTARFLLRRWWNLEFHSGQASISGKRWAHERSDQGLLILKMRSLETWMNRFELPSISRCRQDTRRLMGRYHPEVLGFRSCGCWRHCLGFNCLWVNGEWVFMLWGNVVYCSWAKVSESSVSEGKLSKRALGCQGSGYRNLFQQLWGVCVVAKFDQCSRQNLSRLFWWLSSLVRSTSRWPCGCWACSALSLKASFRRSFLIISMERSFWNKEILVLSPQRWGRPIRVMRMTRSSGKFQTDVFKSSPDEFHQLDLTINVKKLFF